MVLPFDAPDKFLKKYTCFVCGRQFKYEDFELFKSHIIEEHEESRDYVICPLKRCGAPVRCLKSHFKVKHPYEKMPPVKQTKSIIWKDISGKKLKHKKPHFIDGVFISNKMNGKEIHYRSGYEREFYEYLEQLPDVMAYDAETIEIQYFFEGESHKYIPDVQVIYSDGSIVLYEIKPANQTALKINTAKWQAANEYCNIRGWKFVVVTEVGLGKLKNKVKQMLNERREKK